MRNARVNLATDLGTVDVDRPLDVESSHHGHVTGTLGAGGPTVTARAKRGAVTLTDR